MNTISSTKETPRRRLSRRLRRFAVAIAGTATLAGAGLAVMAGTAGAEPNICEVAAQNSADDMAEYEVILPDSG